MPGLLSALNAGKTSLSVSQKAIEVAGNNIANVNTPGYSRQKAVLSPFPVLNVGGFFIGQGVTITNVEREQDVFLTKQLQGKFAGFGEENAKASSLSELERIVNVSETSLASEVDRFFDSWQDLATNPGSQVQRDMTIQRGAQLGKSFANLAGELDTVAASINNDLGSRIDGINQRLQEVAALNQRIATVELNGQTVNSDRDRRDLLLNELSQSIGVQTFEEGDGKISVTLPGGLPLVQGVTAMSIDQVGSGQNMQFQLQVGGTTMTLGANNLGGEFKGLMEVRDQFLPQVRDDLDKLAYSLVSAVNTEHQGGSGLDGVAGRDFFNPLATQDDASRLMAVAIQNADQVAAGTGSAQGDNTNAQRLAALGQSPLIDGSDTFVSFYGKISAKVGLESSQNRLSLEGAQDAVAQMQNLREGKVGVSIEEEMVNLIQFQRGFEASAKFLSTIDQMMDTLLSIKR